MHCIFPNCDYDGDRALSQGIVLYRFPEDVLLRKTWLEALGKVDWDLDLEADSGVCSQHFLKQDFLMTRRGRKLRGDAVPVVNVRVCRICFATDCMLYPMKDNMHLDLSRPSYASAYKILTGHSIEDDKFPPYLCVQCANRLLNCVRFRARSIQAHSILNEIINDYGYITLESIQAICTIPNPHIKNETDNEHIESENTVTDEDLKQDDIILNSIKSENFNMFSQNILIADVRSTNDNEHSLNLQNDPIMNEKNENSDVTNEDIPIDEIVTNRDMIHSAILHGSNTNDHVTTKTSFEINPEGVYKESNNDNVNKEHNIGEVVIGKDCNMNGNFLPNKARRKKNLSPRTEKEATVAPKDLDQNEIHRNWNKENSGGLLLLYKLLSCGICNYRTVSEVQLRRHLENHSSTKLYNCSKCYFLTNSKKKLQFHTDIHANINMHSCDICKKKFTYKNYLKTHLRTHSGEKPFSCDICGKKFCQNNQLIVHLRIHTGEKPFSCNVCSKAFRQNGHLQNHLRLHTGERPYKCDMCNKAFIQRGQLQNHLTIHSSKKLYSCDICGISFSIKGRLATHLKTHEDK